MYIEASVAPGCRSARNNLYSGISLVRQVRSLIFLPCSVSLCFWSFLVSSFPRFLISFVFRSVSRFGFRSVSHSVFRFGFRSVSRSVSRFGLRFVSCSVSRIGFRSVSRSVSHFGFRSVSRSVSHIGFCSTILDSRPTPVLVSVPDSVSVSPSSRQHLPLLLALFPRGVVLYRRQRLITYSHSARPRRVRSCASRPRPVTKSLDLCTR